MKLKIHLFQIIALIVLSLFLTSCAMEKRHYRKGYYVQHTNANNSKQEQQICSDKEREESRVNDVTAKTTSADSASLDVQSTVIANLTAGTFLAAPPDNSPVLEIIPIENQTYSDKSVCNSGAKKTSIESIRGEVPDKQKKKPWLTIAAWSVILALVLLLIFGLGGAICAGVLIVNALIFSIISIGYCKRTRKTDRFDWRKAVATVIAFVSGFGLIVYGLWIWLVIAWGGF